MTCSRLWIFRQRSNGKGFCCCFTLKHTFVPQTTIPPPLPLTFLYKIEESNSSFLAKRIVLGLVSGLNHWCFFYHSIPGVFLSNVPSLVGGGWESCVLGARSAQGWTQILKGSVICLWFSIFEQVCQGSIGGSRFCHKPATENQGHTYISHFPACIRWHCSMYQDLRQDFQITPLFSTKYLYFTPPLKLPTGVTKKWSTPVIIITRLFKELPSAIFLGLSMLAINCFSFPSENVFTSSSFLKDIFSWHRILSWQCFSCSTWKMFYSFGLGGFQVRSSLGSNCCALQVMGYFLSGCFQNFLFAFCSPKFNYDKSQLRFLWIYPLWGLLSFLNVYVYAFHPIWRVSNPILSFLFFCDSTGVNMRAFLTVSQILDTLFIFFLSVNFLLFRLGKFYISVF